MKGGGTLGVLQRFERRLEGMVEGAFARAFRSELQPVEVASAVQREMDDRAAIVAKGRTLVPNDFVVPCYLADRKLRIAVARVANRLYAFADLCPCRSEACPLSAGLLTGTTIMCQCHGSRFDITTGAIVNGPATRPLDMYDVREVHGNIEIRV